MDDLRSRGIIDESTYLSKLKALYQRYFKDKEKYVDQYQKYEKKYLDGMYSLYNSALSGITKLMGKQIDAYSEEKESAVSALEEERDARLAVIDAQKEQLQSQIDIIDKQIDAKEKEKKAIQDAADARKRELTLMKAKYELERMMSQRTQLVYTEDKGMIYRPDGSGIRDAKENVDDAKREIQIAAIEKEIDLLNEKKDLIQEQIDLLDKQADEVESYYSKMIESTEKYYDSLIKSMEKQKSKWEELADIKEVADAYSAIQQVFGDLGYTVEDVLNGNEQAFEDFKAKYIGLMNDMNSNTSFGEGLSYATGVAKENLGSFLDSTKEVADGLDNLGEKADTVDNVATSMGNASTSASELSNSTEGLSNNLNGISDSLNNFPTEDKFSGLVTQFTDLAEAISKVAEALGIAGDSSVGSLVTALSELGNISLEEGETGLISQFNNLANAVNAVSSAINGAGGGTSGDAQDSKSPSMSAGATESGASITSALDELKSKSDEVLGSSGEDDSTGEGTIGQFEQLEQAVKDVSTAIGSGDEEGSQSSGKGNNEEDTSNLIGAITSLGETTTEVMGGGEDEGEGVIGKFQEFTNVVNEANGYFSEMLSTLTELSSQEWEIKVTVSGNGAMLFESNAIFSGGGNGLKPHFKGTVGNAYADGYPGLPQGEKNALRSEFGQPELTVYPNGKYELTTQPTISDLPKDTVIFNEQQTKKILNNKGHFIGNAHEKGTLPDGIRPIEPGDDRYEIYEKIQKAVLSNSEALNQNNTLLKQHYDDMIRTANNISNNVVSKQQAVNFSTGDIIVQGVQDVDTFAKAVKTHFPNAMLQAIHTK